MKRFLIASALATLVGLSSFAAPIVGGAFSNFGAPAAAGTPFWDQGSSDGTGCNVGFFLTNSSLGSCGNLRLGTTSGVNLGTIESLTVGLFNGNRTDFSIEKGNYSFKLLGSITGASSWEVGYSDGTNDYVLFSSAANSVNDIANIAATSDFSLYILSDGNLFRSNNADGNGIGTAAFRSGSKYFFGFEDRKNGDSDYNDMVISMAAETPEPGTWALLGGALVAFGIARFRK